MLSLEDHVNSALAATNILLLQNDSFTEDLATHFTEQNIKTISRAFETRYGTEKLNMPVRTATSMIQILKNFEMGVIGREKATILLLGLDLNTNESKFRKCIVDLFLKLPTVPVNDHIKEMELSTRYANPFLRGLFDDPGQGVFLKWTNKVTLEARQQEDLTMKHHFTEKR